MSECSVIQNLIKACEALLEGLRDCSIAWTGYAGPGEVTSAGPPMQRWTEVKKESLDRLRATLAETPGPAPSTARPGSCRWPRRPWRRWKRHSATRGRATRPRPNGASAGTPAASTGYRASWPKRERRRRSTTRRRPRRAGREAVREVGRQSEGA